MTTEALESLGATIKFIYIWLTLLEEDYKMSSEMYNKAMKYMFKQMPITMIKALTPKQKVQKFIT